MITIVTKSPTGTATRTAEPDLVTAIRAARSLRDDGHQDIEIDDGHGKRHPLEWWETVAEGVSFGGHRAV